MPLVIIYRFGFIVGIVLLLLLIGFILRAIHIVYRQKNQLGVLVAVMAVTGNVSQAIIRYKRRKENKKM